MFDDNHDYYHDSCPVLLLTLQHLEYGDGSCFPLLFVLNASIFGFKRDQQMEMAM